MKTMLVVLAVVLAMAMPAVAKVNLAGSIYATYWAQQEGVQSYQVATAAGWQNTTVEPTTGLYRGDNFSRSKKTFLLAQNMSGNGLTAHAASGYGILLALDCPVTDELKAYARFSLRGNGGTVAVRHLWMSYTPMKELSFRIGRSSIPFGNESPDNPTEKVRRVFISDYTQDPRGALNTNYDAGIMAYGTLFSGVVDYKLWLGNGAISTVADSVDRSINASGLNRMVQNTVGSSVTPDIDDAKQVVGNLKFKPFAGMYVGGSYAVGDYTNLNRVNGVSIQRARFTAADVFAGYEMANLLRVSGEYATTRHDRISRESDFGVLGAPAVPTALAANRVNEYIMKAIYLGLTDWEFGVRYTVIDPKNFEAEVAAGYSNERKLSFATSYKFSGTAQLAAEYSRIYTNLNYLSAYDPTAMVGAYRVNPAEEPDDDIFALQLSLQF